MTKYKYSKNRKSVKNCPCGKSNADGKFSPFEGHEKWGHCHSCGETFFPDNSTIIDFKGWVKTPETTPSYLGLKVFNEMYIEKPKDDNLTEFLKIYFSKDEIFEARQRYFITGTNYFWKNSTALWQIDENEKIRGCKIMLFDKTTGKRVKEPYNHVNWLHKALKQPDFWLVQCLFGLHLIDRNTKVVALVEGEKTAIIMSILKPEYLWLATGGKENLKFDFLKPIKHLKVVAFPDKGEYSNWKSRATELNGLGFKIQINQYLENLTKYSDGTDIEDGADIADIVLKERMRK